MEGHRKSVTILGGGISGLAAAYYLSRFSRESGRPLEIRVVESAGHWGGAIRTEIRDGFLLEHGPDAFAVDRPALLELCRELGLGPELTGIHPDFRRICLRRGEDLFFIPRDFHLMAPARLGSLLSVPFLSWRGKLRMAAECLVPVRRGTEDESLGHFMRRRFGREALEHFGQPLMGSIFGCDILDLSLLGTFPRFREMELKSGSVIRALQAMKKKTAASSPPREEGRPGMFMTLRSGMSRLIDRLREETGAEWLLRTRAEKVYFDKTWQVQLAGGRVLASDFLCTALPAFTAAGLFAEDPALRALLGRQPSKSMRVVHAAFREEALGGLPRAAGWVGSADRKRKIQGGSFSSFKFEGRAPGGTHLVRLFPGYLWEEALKTMSDDAIGSALAEEFCAFFKVKDKPLFVEVSRHEKRMPHYGVGHLNWLEEVEAMRKKKPGLILAGNSYSGSSLPHCIERAKEAASEIIKGLEPAEEAYASACNGF